MKVILREVSLLLDQFQRSEWRDLYVRNARYELFLAKTNGAANPMVDGPTAVAPPSSGAAAPPAGADARGVIVLAPHLATVRSIAAVGSHVRSDSVVTQLEVLGALEEVMSRAEGTVTEVLAPAGTLVEFETPLLIIV